MKYFRCYIHVNVVKQCWSRSQVYKSLYSNKLAMPRRSYFLKDANKLGVINDINSLTFRACLVTSLGELSLEPLNAEIKSEKVILFMRFVGIV